MSEELLQRDLINNPEKIGKWDFYNIGATSVKALKGHGIIRSVDYGKVENKKPDALLVQKKNVIAVIEYKKPSEFNTKEKQEKAIKQELEVAQKLDARIFIASDKQKTIWINPLTGNKIRNENGEKLIADFNLKDEKLPDLIDKIIASINEKNDQIKPKELINPTNLAKQIWQDIWSVSGATPENCLYTFVELFIFKYLSDLDVLHGMFSFYYLCDNFDKNTDDELLETYANSIRPKIKTLFKENPKDHTTIINGTIFVSKDQKAVKGYSTVFKKILTKFRDYGKLEHIDYDFKSQLFESFLKESISKKNWGQFFTPLKVVRAIVEMAKDEIKEGVKICDPACGVGKFLLEPIITQLDRFYEIKNGKLTSKIQLTGFDKGFDKDEQKTIILAKANMLIYFSDLIKGNTGLTKEFSRLFNESFTLKTNSILGTLSEPVTNEYDLILTNPPYVTSGSSNLKEEIKKDGELVNYFKINAMGVEGLFMEWIIRALKPNGKAFIVVPDGILDRGDQKYLRRFILDECLVDAIISLPENTFFTTNKKTYILCLTKKTDKKEIQKTPVFTYLVSEIGESKDIYRFDIEENDLIGATEYFNLFKGNKRYFAEFNNNKRCKLLEMPFFENNIKNNWSIDKCWTKDELFELGVTKQVAEINCQDFPYLLEDMSSTIDELKEELKNLLSINTGSNVKTKEYKLSDLFDFPSIKGLTKTFIRNNSGKIPVYGGRQDEIPIGYIADDLEGVKYFENCLGWNREGSVGYVFYHQHKFTTNDHHRPLLIKNEFKDVLAPDYIKIVLQELLFEQGFRWSKTASKEKVQELKIGLPIDDNGNISLEIQNRLSERTQKIEEIKQKIQEKSNRLINIKIVD
jgi:type I restriction-modification system DNA methylase subunit